MSWTRNHVANFRFSSSCMVSNACRVDIRHLALPEFQWGTHLSKRQACLRTNLASRIATETEAWSSGLAGHWRRRAPACVARVALGARLKRGRMCSGQAWASKATCGAPNSSAEIENLAVLLGSRHPYTPAKVNSSMLAQIPVVHPTLLL